MIKEYPTYQTKQENGKWFILYECWREHGVDNYFEWREVKFI